MHILRRVARARLSLDTMQWGLKSAAGVLVRSPVLRAPSRSRLVVRASGEQLESWQVDKLQQALLAGRRQVKVEKLCKDVGLPRGTVLQWLKDAPPPDRTQQSLLEARAAAENAAEERRAVLREGRQQQQAAGAGREASRPAPGGGNGRAPGGGNGQAPAWQSYYKKKALGRQTEATLEMMYTRTKWPTDDAVSGLWDLHRLPRQKVIDWFKQRRQQDERPGGGGGSSGPRGGGGRSGPRGGGSPSAGGSGGASTDWDAEWRTDV